MDWLLRKIERIRRYPESVRVLMLWVSVGIASLVIGALWIAIQIFTPNGPAEQPQAEKQQEQSTAKFLPDALVKQIQELRANLPSLRKLISNL